MNSAFNSIYLRFISKKPFNNNCKIKKDIKIKELMEEYIKKCDNATKKLIGFQKEYPYLEKCKLFYEFNDI